MHKIMQMGGVMELGGPFFFGKRCTEGYYFIVT